MALIVETMLRHYHTIIKPIYTQHLCHKRLSCWPSTPQAGKRQGWDAAVLHWLWTLTTSFPTTEETEMWEGYVEISMSIRFPAMMKRTDNTLACAIGKYSSLTDKSPSQYGNSRQGEHGSSRALRMKLNTSFLASSCQKVIQVDDERKLRTLYEKHMATRDCVVQISGGNDKQGFPMKQNISTHRRVHLLLNKGHSRYRSRRTRWVCKSVEECIVYANLSILNLAIRGPKRTSGMRKLFNLSREDDVCQDLVRKPLNQEGKNPRIKAPETQCHKHHTKLNKEEASEHATLLTQRMKEAKEKYQEQIDKRRRLSSRRASTSKPESSQK
ncbi:hypothetical protein U0070_002389 [Myodes glareolus]|uniref:Small ribosomal subunit protein eS6 n=1 Tax=Myodes glareolus TaxID=447135 RepID=A0AAW0IXJ4_MYOGA